MDKPESSAEKIARMRLLLLAWYGANRRELPWRRTQNPYAVWVSEIMLQQTRVAVVVERYQAFLARFPTLRALAQAGEDEVLALWSGLGYYRRARMLHRAARLVAAELDGNLPQTAKELRRLPGIGAYTSAAIASIAHGERVAVVDGNVERVLCRLKGWAAVGHSSAGADAQRRMEALAAKLVSPERPGDWNQALMELGATVCLPRNPLCAECPLRADCKTQGEHPTAARPSMQSREVAHALSVRNGAQTGRFCREVLLEQRPATESVMTGMWELPRLKEAAVPEDELRIEVRHAIMQVNYSVRIRTVFEDDVEAATVPGGARRWITLEDAAGMALTGLTRKVLSRLLLLPTGLPDGQIAPEESDSE